MHEKANAWHFRNATSCVVNCEEYRTVATRGWAKLVVCRRCRARQDPATILEKAFAEKWEGLVEQFGADVRIREIQDLVASLSGKSITDREVVRYWSCGMFQSFSQKDLWAAAESNCTLAQRLLSLFRDLVVFKYQYHSPSHHKSCLKSAKAKANRVCRHGLPGDSVAFGGVEEEFPLNYRDCAKDAGPSQTASWQCKVLQGIASEATRRCVSYRVRRWPWDAYIAPYCPAISMALGCNCNLSIVTDRHVGRYILKYVSKPQKVEMEPHSRAADAIERIVETCRLRQEREGQRKAPESETFSALYSALAQQAKSHSISAVRAAFVVLTGDTFLKSHDAVHVNTNVLEKLFWREDPGGMVWHGHVVTSTAFDYAYRPHEVENLCAYEYFRKYERRKCLRGIRFLAGHPLHGTHSVQLRSRPAVVVWKNAKLVPLGLLGLNDFPLGHPDTPQEVEDQRQIYFRTAVLAVCSWRSRPGTPGGADEGGDKDWTYEWIHACARLATTGRAYLVQCEKNQSVALRRDIDLFAQESSSDSSTSEDDDGQNEWDMDRADEGAHSSDLSEEDQDEVSADDLLAEFGLSKADLVDATEGGLNRIRDLRAVLDKRRAGLGEELEEFLARYRRSSEGTSDERCIFR